MMVFVTALYAVFFLAAQSLVSTRATRLAAELILYVSGYAIVIFGLLNAMGHIYKKDAIWFTSGAYRLTSVFQYSNTYAGFLLALLLCAAFSAVNAKRRVVSWLHAFMLVPIWISFMLTYSRGALVLLPVLALAFVVFLRLDRQIAYAGALLVSAAASFVILGPFTERYVEIMQIVLPKFDGDPAKLRSVWDWTSWQNWLLLLAAAIVTSFLTVAIRAAQPWLEHRLSRLEKFRFSSFVLPAASALLGALVFWIMFGSQIAGKLLPQSISERIANINFRQHSVLERMTFYQDALKVSADYPLLGAGGGAWNALYEKYQNNPYVSRQAHSFFFQTLVEVGWIGLLIVIGLIGIIFAFYLRQYWKERAEQPGHFVFFILVFSILAHSMIDFDMSYVYIGALVFFSLGVLGAVYRDNVRLPRFSLLNQVRWRYLYPAFLGLMSVTILIQVYQEYTAAHYYQRALTMAVKEQRPLHELLDPLDKAIAYSPAHPTYNYVKIDWLSQAFRQTGDRSYALQAKELIERIKSTESYDRMIILSKYRNHKDLGEYNELMEALEEGISKFQWDIQFYEAAIMEYALNGNSVKATDPDRAQIYWNRGMELYEEILRREHLLASLPEEQLQGRSFDVTPFIRQAVGQILYGQGRYEDAVSMLQPLVESDLRDIYNRIGVRHYLAALHKLGQSDTVLMNRLIEADPNEHTYLESLLQ
jgi:tetratricopeptide (TPR) repeat protein